MENNPVISVIDLKAFYSFVECVDRGLDPFTTPLVVADKERGTNTIVLSVTPFLKAKGIPSRCRIKELPSGINYIYAVPRMERYIEKSSQVISILLDFVSEEDLHVYSIDEAFLDLTPYLNYYKRKPMDIIKDILRKIKDETGLMATAGIGPNFFLAKVALDIYAKKEKDGIAIMKQSDIKSKLWPIDELTKVWGIGERTALKLHRLGIQSVKDIAKSDIRYLKMKFGVMGEQLYQLANGKDETNIREIYLPKSTSLSNGQALFKDYDQNEIITIIREMNDDLSLRMRNENKKTNVVSLSIGYSGNIGGFAKQMSLLKPTDDSEVLFDVLMDILAKNIKDYPIRRVGINYGQLVSNNNIEQLDLFEDPMKVEHKRNLQEMIDYLHNKYGRNIILRASALTKSSTAIKRHNQIGGHRK